MEISPPLKPRRKLLVILFMLNKVLIDYTLLLKMSVISVTDLWNVLNVPLGITWLVTIKGKLSIEISLNMPLSVDLVTKVVNVQKPVMFVKNVKSLMELGITMKFKTYVYLVER